MSQQHIRVIYTARTFNPVSWLIRWMVPRSRVALAHSSHSMVVDGDHVIEANMIYGVRRVPIAQAIKGARVVRVAGYPVPNAERGLAWFRTQLCTYVPALPCWTRFLPAFARSSIELLMRMRYNNYDFKGAIGIGFAPDRNWQDPVNWSCFESSARTIKEAGSDVFADSGYITETTLMAVKHVLLPSLQAAA